MDMLHALDVATNEFGKRLEGVDDHAWESPTPCAGWNVHFLVAHVVGGNRFAVLILDGMSAADAISEVMGSPQLGDDAVDAFAATAAAQRAAFRAPGALDRRVDHPLGDISGREFLEFRVFDVTLHAWDLARSIAADDTLAPELVDFVLRIVECGPPGMGFGLSPLGTTMSTSSAQSRLLDLTGRQPNR